MIKVMMKLAFLQGQSYAFMQVVQGSELNKHAL